MLRGERATADQLRSPPRLTVVYQPLAFHLDMVEEEEEEEEEEGENRAILARAEHPGRCFNLPPPFIHRANCAFNQSSWKNFNQILNLALKVG